MRKLKLVTQADPLRNFTIICDSREQMPYKFPNSIILGLKSGDYSLAISPIIFEEMVINSQIQEMCHREVDGLYLFDSAIAVERKRSIDELYACCASQRERFEAELERLAAIKYPAVVCEFSMPDIAMLKFRGFNPAAAECVYQSVVSWTSKFRIPFFFAGNRKLARAITYAFMEKTIKNNLKKEVSGVKVQGRR